MLKAAALQTFWAKSKYFGSNKIWFHKKICSYYYLNPCECKIVSFAGQFEKMNSIKIPTTNLVNLEF